MRSTRLFSWLVALTAAIIGLAAVPAAAATGTGTGTECRVQDTTIHVVYTDLQPAIDQAAAGDRIVVRGTCVGAFSVDKDLTLVGHPTPRAPTPTLQGKDHRGSVLTVATGATVSVERLTITGGTA